MLGSAEAFSRSLLAWYTRARRDLPWRVPIGATGRPDPYFVLLSELMLQQTQVATVIPYFKRFIERFPTIAGLANADEQDVLRLWQGLGYYSRARNLHAAAKKVLTDFAGELPSDLPSLRSLPGVGRYTAGAIASLAFDVPAPILDGNVVRVLCRLDFVTGDPRDRLLQQTLWQRAEQLVPKNRPGDFNSAMMELGATICTPRNPQCLVCPVRESCEAVHRGNPSTIPPAKKRAPTPLHKRWIIAIERDGQWLIEQRPADGRWANLWQFVTIEPQGRSPTPGVIGLPVSSPKKIGLTQHALTHRRYTFTIYRCQATGDVSLTPNRRWASMEALATYPMSKPQLYVARLLKP